MAYNLQPNVFNAYDLEPVPNVCGQTLRELVRFADVSVAHVSMSEGSVSLFHRHVTLKEIYFILQGEGILYRGAEALKVTLEAFVTISRGVPHKLRNVGDGNLEHLVFALPPFDPADVSFTKDQENESLLRAVCSVDMKLINACDGALVYELDSPSERKENNISLAYGVLPPEQKALQHFHTKSDEIYYIVSGRGDVFLGTSVYPVEKGSVVCVPAGVVHALENAGSEDLKALCLSSPPYREKDFIPA